MNKYIYNKEKSFEENIRLGIKYMYGLYDELEDYCYEDFEDLEMAVIELLGYSDEAYIFVDGMLSSENIEITNIGNHNGNDYIIAEAGMDYETETKMIILYEKDGHFHLDYMNRYDLKTALDVHFKLENI